MNDSSLFNNFGFSSSFFWLINSICDFFSLYFMICDFILFYFYWQKSVRKRVRFHYRLHINEALAHFVIMASSIGELSSSRRVLPRLPCNAHISIEFFFPPIFFLSFFFLFQIFFLFLYSMYPALCVFASLLISFLYGQTIRI